jgi:hypothetical protein
MSTSCKAALLTLPLLAACGLTDPSWHPLAPDRLDPDRVYLLGGLGGGFAIAPPEDPHAAWIGLPPIGGDPVAIDASGFPIYAQWHEAGLFDAFRIREARPDPLVWKDGAWRYPMDADANDTVRVDGLCPGASVSDGLLVVVREGGRDLMWRCTPSWLGSGTWDSSLGLRSVSGRVLAWNASDLVLTVLDGGRLALMGGAAVRDLEIPLVGLPEGTPLAARGAGAGFRLALAAPGGPGRVLVQIDAAGSVTPVGALPSPAAGLDCAGSAVLDPSGGFWELCRVGGSMDVVVLRSTAGAAAPEQRYTSAGEPRPWDGKELSEARVVGYRLLTGP